MEALAVLFGLIVAVGVAVSVWRRSHRSRLPVVSRDVSCPLHDCPADVNVRIDGDGRRYVQVVGCSLLPDAAAVALPARTTHLPDSPPCEVVLETARPYPIHTNEVACPQSCVAVLNAAASPVPPRPLECASGVSDALDLMRQADRRSPGVSTLWSSST